MIRLLVVLLLGGIAGGALGDPIVTVSGGSVRGIDADGALSFKGIPYAAAPVGALRWRAPRPVPAWNGVLDGSGFGHDCMQVPVAGDPAIITTTPSEDCLTLNVWRPDGDADGLPVMVWIHGGGFVNGGTSAPVYDGTHLAQRGMVAVSLNYRLGRLGFFAHPALLAAQPDEAGNFGLMDQIAALRWVHENIAVFGGDPAKVTLVGESAGGAAVLDLLTSPVAMGLFSGAMILSGGGRQALFSRPMLGRDGNVPAAADSDAAYAKTLGIEGSDAAALAALRSVPAERLVEGWTLPVLLGGVFRGERRYDGTPMTDGTIVTGTPQQGFAARREARVPIIAGSTAQDLPLQLPPTSDPMGFFGADAARAAGVFNPGGQVPAQRLVQGIGADMSMHEPARFVARSVTEAGQPAWLYRFSYVHESADNRAAGAAHGDDVAYLFDNVELRYGAAATGEDRAAAGQFAGYLANFVKTGDPNGAGLPEWPRFDPARFELMNFGLNGAAFGVDPRAARVELVERAFDRASQAAK
jgi:para-nitrobenzyl esterase